ncbi:MAG: CHAD domain-containing protein [Acidobacteriota bacterium]
MCAMSEGALHWDDPEGVHDMRVASRRLRGALRDFLPHLRRRPLSSSLLSTRRIARALGRVRDFDVLIAALKKTADKAPREMAVGVRRIADFRQAALEEYRMKLLHVVAVDSISALRAEFGPAVEAAVRPKRKRGSSAQATVPADQTTYRTVARDVILRRLEQFEDLSKSLYRPLRVEPLHELRIAAKHLRYALELFQECWEEPTAPFAKQVSRMQSSLGDLHDCDIWIEDFGKAAAEEVEGLEGLEFDYKATSVWLMSHFVKLRSKHLSKALQQWNEWQMERFSSRLRDLVQPRIVRPKSRKKKQKINASKRVSKSGSPGSV